MNKTNILTQMRAIVNAAEQGGYTANEHDILNVEVCPESHFPLIWQCGRHWWGMSTIYNLKRYVDDFRMQGKTYWDFLKGEYPFEYLWDESEKDELYFIIDRDGVHHVGDGQALKKAIHSIFDPMIEQIKAANEGKLPKFQPAKWYFTNLCPTEVEVLLSQCHEHDDYSFEDIIKRLTNDRLSKDHNFKAEYNMNSNTFKVWEYNGDSVACCRDPFELVFFGWPENGIREEGVPYGWKIQQI